VPIANSGGKWQVGGKTGLHCCWPPTCVSVCQCRPKASIAEWQERVNWVVRVDCRLSLNGMAARTQDSGLGTLNGS